MFTNRYFSVFVILALVTVITLTVREAVATSSLVNADRSYDSIERIRLGLGDRSYDAIELQRLGNEIDSRLSDHSFEQVEQLRIQRTTGIQVADRAYDGIEDLRAQRITQ